MEKIEEQTIDVLGVYRVPLMDAELRDALRQFYSPGNAFVALERTVTAYIARCVPLALFDLIIRGVDARFRVGDFMQEMPGKPASAAQVAYDEALLASDGLGLIARRQGCVDTIRAGRIAFYLHYYDPERPMRWTYGEFLCPPVQVVPDALWKLVPYTPVD
jgi:hypothetical protein